MSADPPAKPVSLVIPVYNERESLRTLMSEIDAATVGLKVQVIFVDDGSRDGSWQVIRELAEKDERVVGLRFRRNFGKAAALAAGFTVVNDIQAVVLTLDADLQDDPKEIPRFLDAIAGGLDVVSGWKKVRYDPWHKVFPSRVFNRMMSWLTGVHLHDHNCGFKAYRVGVLGSLRLYGELHRFTPVLAAADGFRVGELVIHHRPRKFGHSKFGFERFLKGFLDLLAVSARIRFGYRPMHLFGGIGVLCGLLTLPAVVAGWWVPGLWLLATGLFVLVGQALMTGLAAEMALARHEGPFPFSLAEQVGAEGTWVPPTLTDPTAPDQPF